MIAEDGARSPDCQKCRSDGPAGEQPLSPKSCTHEYCQPRGPLPLGAGVHLERPSWNPLRGGHPSECLARGSGDPRTEGTCKR